MKHYLVIRMIRLICLGYTVILIYLIKYTRLSQLDEIGTNYPDVPEMTNVFRLNKEEDIDKLHFVFIKLYITTI